MRSDTEASNLPAAPAPSWRRFPQTLLVVTTGTAHMQEETSTCRLDSQRSLLRHLWMFNSLQSSRICRDELQEFNALMGTWRLPVWDMKEQQSFRHYRGVFDFNIAAWQIRVNIFIWNKWKRLLGINTRLWASCIFSSEVFGRLMRTLHNSA